MCLLGVLGVLSDESILSLILNKPDGTCLHSAKVFHQHDVVIDLIHLPIKNPMTV